jgi:hypothetical protein
VIFSIPLTCLSSAVPALRIRHYTVRNSICGWEGTSFQQCFHSCVSPYCLLPNTCVCSMFISSSTRISRSRLLRLQGSIGIGSFVFIWSTFSSPSVWCILVYFLANMLHFFHSGGETRFFIFSYFVLDVNMFSS